MKKEIFLRRNTAGQFILSANKESQDDAGTPEPGDCVFDDRPMPQEFGQYFLWIKARNIRIETLVIQANLPSGQPVTFAIFEQVNGDIATFPFSPPIEKTNAHLNRDNLRNIPASSGVFSILNNAHKPPIATPADELKRQFHLNIVPTPEQNVPKKRKSSSDFFKPADDKKPLKPFSFLSEENLDIYRKKFKSDYKNKPDFDKIAKWAKNKEYCEIEGMKIYPDKLVMETFNFPTIGKMIDYMKKAITAYIDANPNLTPEEIKDIKVINMTLPPPPSMMTEVEFKQFIDIQVGSNFTVKLHPPGSAPRPK